MRNQFTAIFEKDQDWFIAYCLEIPGANGQGKTKEECRQNLVEAIKLILSERRDNVWQSIPDEAIKEVITVE
jgi:predicted RNase H-like HicB family nuclease